MAKTKKKPVASKKPIKSPVKPQEKTAAKATKSAAKIAVKPTKIPKAKVTKSLKSATKASASATKLKVDKPVKVAAPVKVSTKNKAETKSTKIVAKASPKKEELKKSKTSSLVDSEAPKKAVSEIPKKVAKDDKKVIAAKTDKDAKKKKKEGEEEEFEAEEFEELEVAETYGDAIRLTSQDLEDPEEMFLTDAEGRRYCKVKDCDQLSVVEGFCRFHYLSLWKKIQTRKKILIDGKLEKYIEELTSRYPDKYLEMIKRDLKTEKDFLAAIQELEIDDSADGDMEEDSGFIDEVRGMAGRGRAGDESSGGGTDESF